MKIKGLASASRDLGISLANYQPISIGDLLAMPKEGYKDLVTLYFREGKYKFADIGIYDIDPPKAFRNSIVLTWSAYSGDPSVMMEDTITPIVCETYSGEWSYTLLRPLTT